MERYFKFLIYLVVVILINLVGMTLFWRHDLTENHIYSLSPASRQAVSTLSEPLTINVFFTENLPAPHNSTKRYLQDLLDEYAVYANRYFNFRFYDVSPQEEGISGAAEENRKLAESYGIHPVQIRMIEQDEVKFKNAYMGLVILHGDLIERIPAITSTDGLEYKLTTAVEKLNKKISTLAALPEPVDITLVMSSSLKRVAPYIGADELPKLPGEVETTVRALNGKTYGKLSYAYIDPDAEGNLQALREQYDLLTLKWPALAENGIAAGEGGIGLVMSYGDRSRTIRLMNIYRIPLLGTQYELVDMASLEEIINENLETLIGINEDLGYLAGHGTLEVNGGMPAGGQNPNAEPLRNFESLISENYTLRQVNLEDGPIPESLNTLVIAHPTEKFSDYELYQIDQALMRGTSLAVFSDAFEEVPNPNPGGFSMGPTYRALDTGLEKLLAHYGVQVQPSYALDKNCYKQAMGTRGGEQPIYFAPIIKNEFINHDVDFLKNIKGLITLNNSPVYIDETAVQKNQAVARTLFSSSDQSWLMKGQISLNPMFINPPSAPEEYESRPLACLLEGTFTSYYNGKPIPEKPTDGADEEKAVKDAASGTELNLSAIESSNNFRETGRPARLLVVGSSALLRDNLLDREGATPNAAFVLNAIDALNGRGEIAAMRSKTQQFNPLDETTPVLKGLVKFVNIAGLPVFVVLFGLAVWWGRRIKRRRIRLMFAR